MLRIPGEHVCEVAPLRVPSWEGLLGPEGVADYPGVVLFARRGREVRPDFAVTADNAHAVVQVCGLSEGLPLFLELAAARPNRGGDR